MNQEVRRRHMDRKIVERLIQGEGINAIARVMQVGKKRVRTLCERAKEYGYLDKDGKPGQVPLPPYPEAIFPDKVDGRTLKLSDSHRLLKEYRPWIEERLLAGWHAVTVFEELPIKTISRSSFYRYLKGEKLNCISESHRIVPEIIHKPGEALVVDWGKLRSVIDPQTGKNRTLWMFTGVLGFSRYLMARLVWKIDVETTLRVLESMFQEIKGVPFKVTSDNPKCFALEASPYEPLLNPAYERFAAHYGTLIECLPPRSPKLKGKIERPIPFIRRLYEAHGDAWLGIEESQQYLDRKLSIANERKHGTTLQRPKDVFLNEEAKALKPLPALAYEIEQFHEGLVRKDGYVRFQNKYYSLDEKYKGEEVVVLGNSKLVSIYHKGRLLEVHERITNPHQSKSTKPQHLKPWERTLQDASFYCQRAARVGPHVEEMVHRLLKQGQGFIDTRKIWGILSLDKRYKAENIDAACKKALELDSLSFRTVRNILAWEELKAAEQKTELVLSHPSAVEFPKKSQPEFVRPISEYEEQLPLLFSQEEGNA